MRKLKAFVRSGISGGWWVALLFYPLAVTWPLVASSLTSIPQGSEHSATVPLFNLWTLSWNVKELLIGYRGYWDAPIFWPSPGAFAFSDAQPLTGLLAAPWWGYSPALAYNLILWGYLAANGLTVYWFLRRRQVAVPAALIAGLLAQSLPYLTHERGVLQLQPYFGMLWAVEGLWRLSRAQRARGAVFWLAAGLSVTFLTSAYYGVFLLVLLPPFLVGLRPRAADWSGLALALSAGMLAPLALFWHQRAILQQMGFDRSLETIRSSSACLGDYWHLTPRLFQWFSFEGVPGCGQHLFPGVGLLILGLIGAGIALRRRGRALGWALLLSATLAVLVSFGPRLTIGGRPPYEALRAALPGYENLRSPFRFALWLQVGLALFSGFALDALWARRRWLVIGLGALLLVELFPRPEPLIAVPAPYSRNVLQGVTVFLPFPSKSAAAAYAQTTRWMWRSLTTEAVLVNGYSGYFPVINAQLKERLAAFPDTSSVDTLQALGVENVCVAAGWLVGERGERMNGFLAAGVFLPGEELDDSVCYRLAGTALNTADGYAGEWAVELVQVAGKLRLRTYAAVPDSAIYVVVPGVLRWELRWQDAAGTLLRQDVVEPLGAVLLYHGSDRWLRTDALQPPAMARSVVLVDAARHVVLGEAVLP